MSNCCCLGFSTNQDCPTHGQPIRKSYERSIARLNLENQKLIKELEIFKNAFIANEKVRDFYKDSTRWQEYKTDLITFNKKGEGIWYLDEDTGLVLCEGGKTANDADKNPWIKQAKGLIDE